MSHHDSREAYNKYMREYMLRRYHTRRAYAVKQLGGKCVECGSKKNLEFDHKDAKTKAFDLAKNFNTSLERLNQELAKCQLLCRPCHSKKSVLDAGNQPAAHGTLTMATHRRCRCDACLNARRAYNRVYKKKIRGVGVNG